MTEVLYTIIPEDIVEDAAHLLLDEEGNSFEKVLSAGNEFKAAGLEPVYLLDKENMQLFVVTLESLQKKLN